MRGIDEQAGLSISARKRKSDEKGERGKAEKQKAIIADGLLSWNLMVPGSLSKRRFKSLFLLRYDQCNFALCPQKGPQTEFHYALRDGQPEERSWSAALQAPKTTRNASATA